MDNYLSSRWPAGMAAQPEPEQKKRRSSKKRRVWRDILIVFVALVVLCALVAGSFFGVQFAAERLASQSQSSPSQGSSGKPNLPSAAPDAQPTVTGTVEENQWSADLLPEGEPDPTVQIELLSREGAEILTGAEIYKEVLPSIVVVYAANELGYGVGSGVVLSENGYILTNYHVIEESLEIAVQRLSDDAYFYGVTLVGYDKALDLAVLKADGTDFTPAEIGNSDELEVGDQVYAIGNPLGYLRGAMTDGIVSVLGDRVNELDYEGRLIQTSAALNSGNSGGALIDSYGRVVGITYAKITGVREDVVLEGLGLAIPMADARSYVNRILRTGDSARLSLGIQCYSGYTLDGVVGMLVVEATEGTPAYGVLKPNDLIIEINGVRVQMVDDVTRILNELDPDDTVEVTVIRNKKPVTLTMGLYDRLPELQ